MQQIASPKSSRDWVLVPNHAMLTLHWAECLAAQPGAKAAVAPKRIKPTHASVG